MTAWALNIYSSLMFASGSVTLSLGYAAWRRRSANGALAFVALMLFISEWFFAYGVLLGIKSDSTDTYVLWSNVHYIGVSGVPLMWLLFALRYAGHDKFITRRNVGLLAVVPIANVLLVWTDDWHHLVHTSLTLIANSDLILMTSTRGPAWWAHLVYSYILTVVGVVILLRALKRKNLYRSQAIMFGVGALSPLIASVMYATRINPIYPVNFTPFGFMVVGITFFIALFRYRALDLTPIARDVVIEGMSDSIIVLDAQDRITDINPAAQKLFEVSDFEVVGKSATDALAPWAHLAERYRHTTQALDEITIGEGDGRRWYELRLSQLNDQRGRFVGRVLVLRNITEQKHTQEAFVVAHNEALEASRVKSAFLASMSHEIRTPMNGIIGMTSLLLDTPLSVEQLEYTETIRNSGDSLLTIINDILDFSKIEAGKLDMENQIFDLRDCLESAVDLLAFKAAEHGLELGCVIESNVPETIMGDVTRLRQIIVNLLSNAVKFTQQGEIALEVKVESSRFNVEPFDAAQGKPSTFNLQPSTSLHFSIRDTGIGIPKDRMDRLFQSFSQVDSSTTRKYGGTGLGLAISKRLTDLMGGEMWIESEEGVGSTFHFTIQTQAATPPQSDKPLVAPQLKGKRMLIVDDVETNRRILTLQAQSWEMLPLAFSNPLEALEAVKGGEQYDVAILDMHMPEMDGATLANEIRKHAAQLPLIMLTSLGWRATEDVANFSAFLTKPVKQSNLYNAILNALSLPSADAKRSASADVSFDAHLAERLPLKILLAEDNAVNQKLALRLLERMGYRADVAADGLEVLEALERQHYDLVFMDVQMPELDGLEATRQIRATCAPEKQPRIVAMTANAMQGDREECLAAGMDDYVSKPIRVKELRNALEKCTPLDVTPRNSEALPDPASQPLSPLKPAETDTESVDLATLKEYFPYEGAADAVELIKLSQEYFADVEKRLLELNALIAQKETQNVGEVAHAAIGVSLVFGAKRLAALCKELERLTKQGSLEGASEKLAQIEAEYRRVHIELPKAIERMRL